MSAGRTVAIAPVSVAIAWVDQAAAAPRFRCQAIRESTADDTSIADNASRSPSPSTSAVPSAGKRELSPRPEAMSGRGTKHAAWWIDRLGYQTIAFA